MATVIRHFDSENIDAVLIKGLLAGRSYPLNTPRTFVDHDISVAQHDYVRAQLLIDQTPSLRVNVDLHCELRHLDTIPWPALLDRSEFIEFGDVKVRVPCPEDHLRIMAVHWLNDGGQYKERLWDIYYAVANRPPGFDWDKCLRVVSATRRTWVITTIGLAHKYLGLDIEDLPFADEAKNIPKWVTDCVEAEWESEIRLQSLHVVWRDRKRLLQQIRKRIPPNPIQATIETEGEFDEGPRIGYQIRSILQRLTPSVRRLYGVIRTRKQ